jgi:hypothetical protein
MVNVLVDIHIADEIGVLKYTLDTEIDLDSAKIYGWVFKKHGITKSDFDSSLSYYSKEPDILNNIYNKVIANLSKKEAELSKTKQKESERTVIYKDKKIYRLPDEGPMNKIPFDIPLTGTGDFKLNAKILIQQNDQSVNPHITAYYWYDDSTETGIRDYFKPVRLKKTGRNHFYSVSKTLDDPKFTNLRGYILDHDNIDTNFIKHAVVMEISVTD